MCKMTIVHSSWIEAREVSSDNEEWKLLDMIGQGTYGEVFKATNNKTGNVSAIKVLEFNPNKTEEIKTELTILEKFAKHANLVQFFEAFFINANSGKEQLWIVTEFCNYGSVSKLTKKLIEQGNALDEKLISFIIFETMKALKYLHGNKVIHRDIKGSNILLTGDADVKLIDFGVSSVLADELSRCHSSVGTPFWMAPEVIACEQQLEYSYDNRCDIWSLGITSIELADGDPPLADQHPMRALFMIPRSPPPTVQRPDKWTGAFLDFISRCLVKDFERRPFVDDLLQHSFVSETTVKLHILKRQLLALLRLDVCSNEPDQKSKKLVTESRKTEEKLDARRNLEMSKVDNLATLESLTDDVILGHLLERYMANKIYTYVGDILIAVNPFKYLEIYAETNAEKYRRPVMIDLPPHIYHVAQSAHSAVLTKNKDQCCVISGESGSGKTVNANYLVQQLAELGRQGNPSLANKILLVNPLMEAFGNATTVINDNSSRFGKYLELTFTHDGNLVGAQLTEYLLEKSRVVHQAKGERNYHMLYYLISGLDYHRKLGHFDLNTSDRHRYLNTDDKTLDQFACTLEMQEKFLAIQKCFDIIGFSQEEVQSLYCILAAIIHFGDLEIVTDDGLSYHGDKCSIMSMEILKTVSSLLCIRSVDLADAITSTSSVTRGETILRYNTVEQAQESRDATAKALYSRLFSWIVKRINALLKPQGVKRANQHKIGILDIFGFENFKQNSFEQLCINIANEQLQFYFNQHVFEWEFEEYTNEGIPLDVIRFENNRSILEMFLQRPMGMLALLDEESRFPKATIYSLVEKFAENLNANHFQKPKDSTSSFAVYHYAGKVKYDATNFLEKNRDTLSADVLHVLRASDDKLVRMIFQGVTDTNDETKSASSTVSADSYFPKDKDTVNESRPSLPYSSTNKLHVTMSAHFRNSLRSLMAKVIPADPLFVRCIRPNSSNSPDNFDQDKVMTQLRYTGVLETAKIRRQGYSERIPFAQFIERYKDLVYGVNEKIPIDANSCRNILKGVGIGTNWRIGRKKVFLKYFQVTKLGNLIEDNRRKAVIMQRCVKAWLYKVRYRKQQELMIKSVLVLQRHVRGFLARRYFAYLKGDRVRPNDRDDEQHSATKIQSGEDSLHDGSLAVRGYLARKKFKEVKEEEKKRIQNRSAIAVQAAFRGWRQRRKYQRLRLQERSARKIQAVFRGHQERRSVRDIEEDAARQDTQIFFFLAQIELSTTELTPLLHRTSYPVLFSLRRDATERSRKESLNLKIGSRERVLAVLDGTDDPIQSKYRWAKEQFENKTSAGPSKFKDKQNDSPQITRKQEGKPDLMASPENFERAEEKRMNDFTDSQMPKRSRDSVRGAVHEKFKERVEENTNDPVQPHVLDQYNADTKEIKRMVSNNEANEALWRNKAGKGYPLRSEFEKTKPTSWQLEDRNLSDFQWFTPRHQNLHKTTYDEEETFSSPTMMEDMHNHHNEHEPNASRNITAIRNQFLGHPVVDHKPPIRGTYSYLYGSSIPNNSSIANGYDAKDFDNYDIATRNWNAMPHRGHNRKEEAIPNKGLSTDDILSARKHPLHKGLMNGHFEPRLNGNELRDPHNRLLPRTDLDLQFNRKADLNAHQIKENPAVHKKKPEKLNIKQSTPIILPSNKVPQNAKKSKQEAKHETKRSIDGTERSLTSIENFEKLANVNGFSYGISKGLNEQLHDFPLKKTGRLQQLVST